MKILIVGSKGFLGQHSILYFSKQNNNVYGCDVVTDYAAENYFLIDAVNSDYKSIFQAHRFDICINCSGAAEVVASISQPLRDFTLNTYNVIKLLDAIRQFQPKCKYINLSSAAVYGNPKVLPIQETHPLNPISPYGFHKLASEQICNEFYNIYKIPTISLRIFSAYGEGLKKQFFWDLFKKSQQNKDIILWGTGKESRDYIYVGDILRAIELVIEKAEFSGSAINIANQSEVFIDEAADIFFNAFNKEIAYKFNGQIRVGDPLNWCADISYLRSLGYRQTVDMYRGLENYSRWLKNL